RRAVLMTRHAISPRLAIRILLNIGQLVPSRCGLAARLRCRLGEGAGKRSGNSKPAALITAREGVDWPLGLSNGEVEARGFIEASWLHAGSCQSRIRPALPQSLIEAGP